MANQSPDRRRVLEMLAKAAVASQFPGFSRWVFAAEHQHNPDKPIQPKPADYQPQFFNPAEYRTIEVLTEMIIPTDESPGAKEAGVAEFIDFMAAHGDEDLVPMRAGLRLLDAKSRFLDLQPAEQEELLKSLADKKGAPEGQAFFKLIRRYTVMGYYTGRVGLEELSYPGLEFYSQSPECPHKDDPEHRHLPPARI